MTGIFENRPFFFKVVSLIEVSSEFKKEKKTKFIFLICAALQFGYSFFI